MSHIGTNQLELLLFTIGDKQVYGINVYKVREIMKKPELSDIPNSDHRLLGLADCRGIPTVVIDLNASLGKNNKLDMEDDNIHLVIAEFNNKVQGFLVEKVDKIVRRDWSDVHEPPMGDATSGYLTAVTKVEDTLVQIIDVEKIQEDITGDPNEPRLPSNVELSNGSKASDYKVMVVDDSSMARNKTEKILSSVGVQVIICNNGLEAFNKLLQLAEGAESRGVRIEDELLMVLSDIEMPKMDGLALVKAVRENMSLKNLHIVIQSSISGGFKDRVIESGAVADSLVKWDEVGLLSAVMQSLEKK